MSIEREYNRQMLRTAFQSLFWMVLLARKKEHKFTLTALASKLGIHKSYVSRSFSNPPNWQIDKISDMADAMGVELEVRARDPVTGVIYAPSGILRPSQTGSAAQHVPTEGATVKTRTDRPGQPSAPSIHSISL
jgi:DNA-binding phage protein